MTWVLVVVLALAVDVFARAWRTRRLLEFRADVLDLLAGACRREAPLPPLLAAAGSSHRRREARWLDRVASSLREGAALPDALATLPRSVMPPHAVAVLRAAAGSPRFGVALEAAASDAAEALSLRHRVFLAGLYPLVIVVGGVALHALTYSSATESGALGFQSLRGMGPGLALLLLATAAAGVGVSRLLSRLRFVPGARNLASARTLRAGALLVEAGLPAAEAMRRAADVGNHPALGRELRAAADAVDGGESPEVLWTPLALTGADRLRLASAGPRLGGVLRAVADGALLRWRARAEAWLAWMQPAAIVLVGVIVFVDVKFVLGVIQNARDVARLW